MPGNRERRRLGALGALDPLRRRKLERRRVEEPELDLPPAGSVSSGRPAAASSLVTRAIPTASSMSRSSVGQEKSEV